MKLANPSPHCVADHVFSLRPIWSRAARSRRGPEFATIWSMLVPRGSTRNSCAAAIGYRAADPRICGHRARHAGLVRRPGHRRGYPFRRVLSAPERSATTHRENDAVVAATLVAHGNRRCAGRPVGNAKIQRPRTVLIASLSEPHAAWRYEQRDGLAAARARAWPCGPVPGSPAPCSAAPCSAQYISPCEDDSTPASAESV